MTTKNSKTQQLLELAQHQFGENIQIEYKPGGLTSGWYLSKNDHSYCIGKNELQAKLWIGGVPKLLSWNLGEVVEEYINNTIIHQLLNVQKTTQQAIALKIIEKYQSIGKSNTGLIPFLWAIGTPLKKMLGYYPSLILSGRKGSGKSTLVMLISRSISTNAINSVSEILTKGDILIVDQFFHQKSDHLLRSLLHNDPFLVTQHDNDVQVAQVALEQQLPLQFIKIEYLPIQQKKSISSRDISKFPIKEWIKFLIAMPRSDFNKQLDSCYQEYCRATAPPHPNPGDINNTILMLLTWKLLCNFMKLPDDSTLEQDVTTSIFQA